MLKEGPAGMHWGRQITDEVESRESRLEPRESDLSTAEVAAPRYQPSYHGYSLAQKEGQIGVAAGGESSVCCRHDSLCISCGMGLNWLIFSLSFGFLFVHQLSCCTAAAATEYCCAHHSCKGLQYLPLPVGCEQHTCLPTPAQVAWMESMLSAPLLLPNGLHSKCSRWSTQAVPAWVKSAGPGTGMRTRIYWCKYRKIGCGAVSTA
jgi:hypothetical protein